MTKAASARQLLEQVSADLRLSVESQDWGIVNADGERLEEFVEYLVTRQLLPTQVFEMVGLLFASANERLIKDRSADLLAFRAAAARHKDAARAQYEYWVRLNDSEEFPLGDWLRGNRTMFGTAE